MCIRDRRVGVHTARGRGACRADGTARALRRGADVVDGRALNGERQRLALVQQLHHAGVGGVTGGVDHARQQHGVPCLQRRKILLGEGRFQYILHRCASLQRAAGAAGDVAADVDGHGQAGHMGRLLLNGNPQTGRGTAKALQMCIRDSPCSRRRCPAH